MALDLVPRNFWDIPSRFPTLLDLDEEGLNPFFPTQNSGLQVSEDEQNVYIEAALPGVDPKNIDVTYDKRVLWIRGQDNNQEEDKKRKFYRRSNQSFSYRLTVPGEIDEAQEPDAVCKNGVMRVTFKKQPRVEPKKLNIRTE